MRFSNNKVSVTFEYDNAKACDVITKQFDDEVIANKQVRVTTCKVISVKPDQKPENGKVLGSGVSIQSPYDSDCKVMARKVALAKALKNAKFNKDRRTRIWTEYFTKTKR